MSRRNLDEHPKAPQDEGGQPLVVDGKADAPTQLQQANARDIAADDLQRQADKLRRSIRKHQVLPHASAYRELSESVNNGDNALERINRRSIRKHQVLPHASAYRELSESVNNGDNALERIHDLVAAAAERGETSAGLASVEINEAARSKLMALGYEVTNGPSTRGDGSASTVRIAWGGAR